MNSTVLVTAPPRETAFLTKFGRISEPWLSWFSSITSTASVVQNLQSLQVIAEDNSTDANTAAILAELLDAVTLLAEPLRPDPVADNTSEFVPSFAALKAEVDELRALLVAGEPSRPALEARTNGTPNGSQSFVNLAAGSNVTLAESYGTVTISSSGGGGGGSFSIDVGGVLVAGVVGGAFTFEVNTATVATYS